MTTHLRIIHAEHREAALAPGNPMRGVPEPVRVYSNADGSLSLYQVAKGYMTTEEAVKHIVNAGLVWHQDILRGAGQTGFTKDAISLARKGIQGLVRLLAVGPNVQAGGD